MHVERHMYILYMYIYIYHLRKLLAQRSENPLMFQRTKADTDFTKLEVPTSQSEVHSDRFSGWNWRSLSWWVSIWNKSLRVKAAHLEDVKYITYILTFQVSSPGCKWVFNSSVTVTSQFTWPWAPVEDVHDASSAWQCWWSDLTWRPRIRRTNVYFWAWKNMRISNMRQALLRTLLGRNFWNYELYTTCFSHRNTRVNSINEIETEPPTRTSLKLTQKTTSCSFCAFLFNQADLGHFERSTSSTTIALDREGLTVNVWNLRNFSSFGVSACLGMSQACYYSRHLYRFRFEKNTHVTPQTHKLRSPTAAASAPAPALLWEVEPQHFGKWMQLFVAKKKTSPPNF